MVNTFIIANTPQQCAKLLDYRRLGKQRVEAYQIINILTNKTNSKSWSNHPATKMWKDHVDALKYYYNCCVREWIERKYKNNMQLYEINEENIVLPWWFTWKPLQLSHQCSLLRKDNDHYKNIFKLKENEKEFMDHGYIWILNDLANISGKLHDIKDKKLLTTIYCSPIGTGAPPQYRYTMKECKMWIVNKCVNPKTNRKIKENAAIYNDLKKAAIFYNV